MSNQPYKKSLTELLSNTTDEDECMCSSCGYSQATEFMQCPKCGKWISWPILSEWGKKLPIGIEDKGVLVKSFDLIPTNWKIEKEIGNSWNKLKGATNLSEYIGTILAHTVTHVGNQDITKFKFDKKLLVLGQMYQADVLYMYVYLRILSMGSALTFKGMECPSSSCKTTFDYNADLATLEIAVHTDPKLEAKIKLQDGFEMNHEQRYELTVRPPLWHMLDSTFPTTINDAELFLAMMTNCTVAIEGMPPGAVLSEAEVAQFTRTDISICQEVLEDTLAGPRWEIEGSCPKCHEKFYRLIDWRYDSFFVRSSRLPRKRRR